MTTTYLLLILLFGVLVCWWLTRSAGPTRPSTARLGLRAALTGASAEAGEPLAEAFVGDGT